MNTLNLPSSELHKKSKFYLKEYQINTDIYMPPPEPEGWSRFWQGYYQSKESVSAESREAFKSIFTKDSYDAFVLEMFFLLSMQAEPHYGEAVMNDAAVLIRNVQKKKAAEYYKQYLKRDREYKEVAGLLSIIEEILDSVRTIMYLEDL